MVLLVPTVLVSIKPSSYYSMFFFKDFLLNIKFNPPPPHFFILLTIGKSTLMKAIAGGNLAGFPTHLVTIYVEV